MPVSGPLPKVLFHRRFRSPLAGSNGGNLKLRDCYDHITYSDQYIPTVYFAPDTVWNENKGNYWSDLRSNALPKWRVDPGDILFFSGKDWQVLSPEQMIKPPAPIINIVQPRHIRKEDKRNAYLDYPAIRIAKSQNGADLLNDYGVNGPLFVIPDAIDLGILPEVPKEKDIDILIIGLKQPDFAQSLFTLLNTWNDQQKKGLNIEIQLPPKLPTRMDFLRLLSRAKIAACIPLEPQRGAEGFYLPALEAMALQCLVVCPHAVGNIDHCLHDINCIVPEYHPEAMFKGVQQMLDTPEETKNKYLQNGNETAERHRIENEREATLDLVHRAHEIWRDKSLFKENVTPKENKLKTLFQNWIRKK